MATPSRRQRLRARRAERRRRARAVAATAMVAMAGVVLAPAPAPQAPPPEPVAASAPSMDGRGPLLFRSAQREPIEALMSQLDGLAKADMGNPADEQEEQAAVCIAMPMERGSYQVSSSYGYRTHPILGGRAMHTGTDFAAPMATPIYAVADGTVVYRGAGQQGRSSELLIIAHRVDGEEFYSWYVHSYPSGIHVSVSDEVSAGQHIADVGDNGMATGPHLHFEIHTASPAFTPPAAGATGGMARFGITSTFPLLALTTTDEVQAPADDEPAPSPEPDPEPPAGPEPEPSPSPTPDPEPAPTPTTPAPSPSPSPKPEPSESPSPTPADEGESKPWPSQSPSQSPAPSPSQSRSGSDSPGSGTSSSGGGSTRATTPLPPGAAGTTVDPVPYLRALGHGLVSPSQC